MDPCRGRAVGLTEAENKSVDILEPQRPKISRPGVETVAEKGSKGRQASLHGSRAYAALVGEEVIMPLDAVSDRIIARRCRMAE